MKAVKINLWGRGGQYDLGGQLFNLIFFRKSGSTILFRAFNNLKIESYINLSKCYEGCKDLGRVEILHWPYKTPKLRMWRVVGEMHSRDQAVTLCNHWQESETSGLNDEHSQLEDEDFVNKTYYLVCNIELESEDGIEDNEEPETDKDVDIPQEIKISCWVASEEGKVMVDSSCLLLKFDIRGKLSTPEYPGMTASTPVDGVKCPPWVVLLPWKGTVKFDCVSCQYGTPPPAEFRQVVQMISPEITVQVKISCWVASEEGKYTPINVESHTQDQVKISYWVASEEGKKFDIRGKLSTPEYLGMTVSTPVDGVKCPPWVVLLPWKVWHAPTSRFLPSGANHLIWDHIC
ncbi:hypothetical protein EDD22DRAFT_852586 [Suillus occidentalis]|nr:hypothetical protein EDD22DRAFT_852586 [Suillus occidentalis]